MFVCLCTGATSHVVHDCVAKGASTSKEVAAACGAAVRMRTVQAHRAVDNRGAFRQQRPRAGNLAPLVQQLPDAFDAEAGQVEIAGEESLVAQPGLQPSNWDGELDRDQHLVVTQVPHCAA